MEAREARHRRQRKEVIVTVYREEEEPLTASAARKRADEWAGHLRRRRWPRRPSDRKAELLTYARQLRQTQRPEKHAPPKRNPRPRIEWRKNTFDSKPSSWPRRLLRRSQLCCEYKNISPKNENINPRRRFFTWRLRPAIARATHDSFCSLRRLRQVIGTA